MRFHHVARYFGLAVIVAGGLAACKPKGNNTDLDAIVSLDGKSAFSLIPMRQYYELKDADNMTNAAKRQIENALRVAYGPVLCTGEDAAGKLNGLEDLARKDPDFIRHQGASIVIYSGAQRADVPGCSVVGKDMMSIGSFVGVFAKEATSQADFEVQQTMWLAARGRANSSSADFSSGFYFFLKENLGAVPAQGADKAAAIAKIDAIYNPCAGSVRGAKFDKMKAFTCDENKNYRVTDDFNATFDRFRNVVASLNESYVGSFAHLKPEARTAVAGLEVAAKVHASIGAMQLPTADDSSEYTAPKDPAAIEDELDPQIAMVLPHTDAISRVFQVHIGMKPDQVLSTSNPAALMLPPGSSGVKFALGCVNGQCGKPTTSSCPNGQCGKPAPTVAAKPRPAPVAANGWTPVMKNGVHTGWQGDFHGKKYTATTGTNGKYAVASWAGSASSGWKPSSTVIQQKASSGWYSTPVTQPKWDTTSQSWAKDSWTPAYAQPFQQSAASYNPSPGVSPIHWYKPVADKPGQYTNAQVTRNETYTLSKDGGWDAIVSQTQQRLDEIENRNKQFPLLGPGLLRYIKPTSTSAMQQSARPTTVPSTTKPTTSNDWPTD